MNPAMELAYHNQMVMYRNASIMNAYRTAHHQRQAMIQYYQNAAHAGHQPVIKKPVQPKAVARPVYVHQTLAHQCTVCPYSTTHKGYLKAHMRCHTAEKKYQCDDCPEKFTSRTSLMQHKRLHNLRASKQQIKSRAANIDQQRQLQLSNTSTGSDQQTDISIECKSYKSQFVSEAERMDHGKQCIYNRSTEFSIANIMNPEKNTINMESEQFAWRPWM